MGLDPESKVGDQDLGSPGKLVSSGLQVAGRPGYCLARTRIFGELTAAFSFQNVPQLHQQR